MELKMAQEQDYIQLAEMKFLSVRLNKQMNIQISGFGLERNPCQW